MDSEAFDSSVDELDQRCESTVVLIRRMGGTCTPRELARRLWQFRETSRAALLLDLMVDTGLGTRGTRSAGAKGGRPGTVFVLNDIDGTETKSGSAATAVLNGLVIGIEIRSRRAE